MIAIESNKPSEISQFDIFFPVKFSAQHKKESYFFSEPGKQFELALYVSN